MKGEQRGEGRGIDYGLGVRLAVTGEGEIVSEINDDYNHHNPPPLSTITKTQNQPTNHNYHRESDRKKKKGKKKKSQKWSKVAADAVCGSPFVCLITILPMSDELWKLKTAKMCFQFP